MITKVEISDYAELSELWEQSVRATHEFLNEEDISYFKSKLESDYFPNVRLWKYVIDEKICGFIGLSDMIEMLFVQPSCFRHGIGGKLIDFAIKSENMKRVDVNEQNPNAIKFYQSKGFKIIGRSEIDSDGKPFPIIHMSL